MAKTKKPSGLSIARDNMKFAFSWKIADADYGEGLQFQWKTNQTKKGTWEADLNLSTKTTSRTVSLTAANFYPTTSKKLTKVTFRVRGKRKKVTKDGKTTTYDWSDWVQKDYTVNIPYAPSISAALSSDYDNVTTFSWEASTSTTDSRHFYNIEWQTRLVKACNYTDGSKAAWKSTGAGWNTGTSGRTSSRTITEDAETLANDSYTRWIRVRSRGAAGASAWKYAKHVYAKPYNPVINSYSASSGAGVTKCKINWTAKDDVSHPIDFITLQYLIDTPDTTGLVAPNGATWSDVTTIRDTSGKDAAILSIADAPGVDECMWVRVVATHDHDNNSSYSGRPRVLVGTLSAPTITSISANTSTHLVTVKAASASPIPDARVAVVFRKKTSKGKITDQVIGIMAHNATEETYSYPTPAASDTIAFGVYAFQGSATDAKATGATIHKYTITANMKSSTTWEGGEIPKAPTTFSAEQTNTLGEVLLKWNYPWTQANRAELSWSQNPNAWESTDEPARYIVTNENAGLWRVSGLATGVMWYFRVRLAEETDGNINYGPYSDTVEVDLSSEPNMPILQLSNSIVSSADTFTVSWSYTSPDGSPQAYAEVREATVSGSTITVSSRNLKTTTTAQHVVLLGSSWTVGTVHYLVVRVSSEGGKKSVWSDPVPVTIADIITCSITTTSLVEETITSDNNEDRTVMSLKEMPLTATISGAGAGGTTTLIIDRAEDYHMIRPDGSDFDGFEGETVALVRQDGEGQVSVDISELIGSLDDGAPYRLIAVTEDSYGQTATAEIDFEVHWTHQAEIPSATIVIDGDAAKITPIAPEGFEVGDVCDIYRLSVDPPELIVQNGTFGETYVDPYPAIGPCGGHRIVHRTLNGDYITEDDQPAWVDYGEDDNDILDVNYGIIDFDGYKILITYNMIVNSSWEKDFQKTTYLGGSTQGDWNPGVTRTGGLSAVIATDDTEIMQALRELAEYTGICHVRTQDGSSYAADIQVSDGLEYDKAGKVLEYSLNITRIDPEGYDGVTLDQWEAEPEGATGATGTTGET